MIQRRNFLIMYVPVTLKCCVVRLRQLSSDRREEGMITESQYYGPDSLTVHLYMILNGSAVIFRRIITVCALFQRRAITHSHSLGCDIYSNTIFQCSIIRFKFLNGKLTISLSLQISGSMKGAEERDLMFGKLFGYLSLIRCGKIEKDKDNVLLITDRLLELHNRKGWIREVVCESILSLLNVISSDIIVLIIPKLKELLGNNLLTISDMTAWQLMLCVGIQQISTAPGADLVKTGMLDLLPQSDIVTPSSFLEMTPTLLEATAGFPKVRHTWVGLYLLMFHS